MTTRDELPGQVNIYFAAGGIILPDAAIKKVADLINRAYETGWTYGALRKNKDLDFIELFTLDI